MFEAGKPLRHPNSMAGSHSRPNPEIRYTCSGCGLYCERLGQKFCRRCAAKWIREWRKTHKLTEEAKEKHRSRSTARNYLIAGKLTKQPCEICGEPKVEMHHEDHSKPLMVRWLCRPHHVSVTCGKLVLLRQCITRHHIR